MSIETDDGTKVPKQKLAPSQKNTIKMQTIKEIFRKKPFFHIHNLCKFEETKVDVTKNPKTKLFRVTFATKRFSNDEQMIQKVIGEMKKESYRPATLEELICFLYHNQDRYLSYDEKVLEKIGIHREIIALGSRLDFADSTKGGVAVPYFEIYIQSSGSSVDRDLSYDYEKKIGLLFLGDKKEKDYHRDHLFESIVVTKKSFLPNPVFLGVLI
jgi:hypothetical protein